MAESWVSIELRPERAPTVDRNPIDGTYLIEWEREGLRVMLTEAYLAELVTAAIATRAAPRGPFEEASVGD